MANMKKQPKQPRGSETAKRVRLVSTEGNFDQHGTFRGVVELELPGDFLDTYTSQQEQSGVLNKKKFTLDRLALWVNFGTLCAVIIYSLLTWSMLKVNQTSLELLVESSRGRIIVSQAFDGMPSAGEPLKIAFDVKNVGHSLAAVGMECRGYIGSKLPSGENPAPFPRPIEYIQPEDEPTSLMCPNPSPAPQEFLSGLPTMEDIASPSSPPKRTQFVYGRLVYETLGKSYQSSFCYYVIQASAMSRKFGGRAKDKPFLFYTCPKWNTPEVQYKESK